MTKVGKLFEQEKIEYAKEKTNEYAINITTNLIKQGVDIETIVKATGLKKNK